MNMFVCVCVCVLFSVDKVDNVDNMNHKSVGLVFVCFSFVFGVKMCVLGSMLEIIGHYLYPPPPWLRRVWYDDLPPLLRPPVLAPPRKLCF